MSESFPPQDPKKPDATSRPAEIALPEISPPKITRLPVLSIVADLESLKKGMPAFFSPVSLADDLPPPPPPPSEKPREKVSIQSRIESIRKRYGVEILFGSMTKEEKRVLKDLDAEKPIDNPKDQEKILSIVEEILDDFGPESFEVLLTPQIFLVPGKNKGEKIKEMKPYSYRLKFVNGLFKGTTPTGGGTAGLSLEAISAVSVRLPDELESDGAFVKKRIIHEIEHFLCNHASGKDRFRENVWQKTERYKTWNAEIGQRYLNDGSNKASDRFTLVNRDLKKRVPQRYEIINNPKRPKGFASLEGQLDPDEDRCEAGVALFLSSTEDWFHIQQNDPVLAKKMQERMEYFEDLSSGKMNKAYFQRIFQRNSRQNGTLVKN